MQSRRVMIQRKEGERGGGTEVNGGEEAGTAGFLQSQGSPRKIAV